MVTFPSKPAGGPDASAALQCTASPSRKRNGVKTWEIDIELRVRKTLTFSGPVTGEAARSIVTMVLSGEMDPSHFIEWTDGHTAYRPVPVETFIDNDPKLSPSGRSPSCVPESCRSAVPGFVRLCHRWPTPVVRLLRLATRRRLGNLGPPRLRPLRPRRFGHLRIGCFDPDPAS